MNESAATEDQPASEAKAGEATVPPSPAAPHRDTALAATLSSDSRALTNDVLAEVRRLYELGRYRDALAAGAPLGELKHWAGLEAQLLAGRLAGNLGAPRVGRVLHWLALRQSPRHPQAQYYAAMSYWSRFGTVRAWQRYRQIELVDAADCVMRADWLAMKALMLGTLRDFSRAETLMIAALELDPTSAWLHVELSELLDRQDLHEESLRAAQEALELRPFFRPAVQAAAHRLVQLRRDEEAMELLSGAAVQLQSGEVWSQLAALQSELKDYDAAWESLNQAEACWPLASTDSQHLKWLAGQRCDVAYYRGRYAEAIELAAGIDRPFYQRLHDRLKQALESPLPADRPPRVQLPVPFIRQFHETCAPATLSSIAQYWKKAVTHEEVVQRICYEGTRAFDERRWAEENQFEAREFRVTQECAEALVRAGVPMTLNTVEPGSAHLQAIVGIDVYRGTLLLQDPSERHVGEAAAENFLEHYASAGPRGMVFLPAEESSRLANIELPDAQLYDDYYIADCAIAKFDRANAQAATERMIARAPEHRLTLQCRLSLARYDANPTEQMKLVDSLLAQFPTDANLQLLKCSLLCEFGQRSQRIELLQSACIGELTHPVFWSRLAAELLDDARDHPEALRQLRRAVRFQQSDGRSLSLLGDYYWGQRQREEALEHYRLAAALNDKDESHAQRYFMAARYLRQTEAALGWLRDRYERFGKRNSSPGRTLSAALEQIDQTVESLAILEETASHHPGDGELMCYAALTFTRYNRPERAAECLASAEGKCSQADFARTSGLLASFQGNLHKARQLFLEVLQLDPLDVDAHNRVLGLDMDLDGADEAEKRLRRAVSRFPHSYSLRVLLIQWLRSNKLTAVGEELDRFLQFHPRDAWARREATIAALTSHDLDRAAAEIALALELDPNSEVADYLQGKVFERRGQLEAARHSYRQAIKQNVDYEAATASLLDTCDRPRERAEQLEFVFQQLRMQTTHGDGIVSYREAAHGRMEPSRLLEQLSEARQHRPDLWQTWSMVVHQHLAMNRRQAAVEVANEATERFPLLPRVWLDLAMVHHKAGDHEAELAALEQARAINPHWAEVARELCELYLTRAQFDQAEQVIRQVVTADPRDPVSLATLADCLYQANKKSAALEPLKTACVFAPGYDWAWAQLCNRSREVDDGHSARQAAQLAIDARPHDARCYLRMAEALSEVQELPTALGVLDTAVALDPRCVDLHVLKATYLGRLHRWDEALAACNASAFAGDVPFKLRMHKAYVLHRKGLLPDAAAEMQAALERDPDHYGAWNQLADWAEELGNQAIYQEAAENMVRLDPHQPAPRGYLADALLMQAGGREVAKEQLRAALEFSSNYGFGTTRLFELHLEDKELVSAREVLDIGGPHLPPEYAKALRTELLAAEDSQLEPIGTTAVTFLIEWSRAEDAEPAALMRAVDHLSEPMANRAVSALAASLRENPQLAGAGFALGRLIGRLHSTRECVAMLKSLGDGDAWHATVRGMLQSLATFQKGQSLLDESVRLFAKRLRTKTDTWSAVASTLVDYGENATAVWWTRDWQRRRDATPVQLLAAVASRFECFQQKAAKPIIDHALTLPEDSGTPLLHVWAGLSALLQSEHAPALEHARQIGMHQMNQWYVVGYRMLVSALEAVPSLLAENSAADAALPSKIDAKQRVALFHPSRFGIEREFAEDRLTLWLLRRMAAEVARSEHLYGLWALNRLQAWRSRWMSGRV